MKQITFEIIFLFTMLISCSKITDYDCIGRNEFPTNPFISLEKSKSIANILCKYINNEKVPCIQVSIVDSLGNIWTLSTGTIDKQRKNLVNDKHQLRIASITKTFTATIIFKLIEEGSLSLDDKLINYFPNFSKAPEVTIKNLLNHSSGIKELLTLPDILTSSTLFTDKIWDINSICNTISKKELVFTTGTDCQYSNTNYVLLGLIAEKVTGKEMTMLYKEYIFDLLNTNEICLVPQDKTPHNLISGYDRKLLPTPGWYEVTPQNTAWASAAFTSGALIGNSEQTAMFFYNLLTGKLISQNSLSQMQTFTEKEQPDSEYQKYFGLGLFKFEINGNTYYGHEGIFIGADNIACFRVSDKTTIVIFSNISTFNKFNLLKEIDDVL